MVEGAAGWHALQLETGGGDMPRSVQLFLDETGDFDEPSEPVAVVGLLLEGPATRRFDEELRAAIVRTAPHLPWPHHATELSSPVGQLLSPLARGPLGRDAPAELHEAARVLGIEPGALAPGRIPSQARALHERLVTTAPALAAALQRLASRHREGMRAIAGALAKELGPSGISVVAACEAPTEQGGDRWLRVTEALLRRVGRLLSFEAQAHTLLVSAESRDVAEPGFAVRFPLQPRHLGAAGEAGFASLPPRADGERPVRLVADVASRKAAPAGYRAGVVLADWIGGQLGWMLRAQPRRPLHELAHRASLALALPITLQPTGASFGLPMPCATGAAELAVEAAFAGRAPETLEALQSGWVREQARAWIAAARRRGAGGAA